MAVGRFAPEPVGAAARREPAHGAAGLAVRPLRRAAASCCGSRTSIPSTSSPEHEAGQLADLARARPRLGRARRPAVRAPRTAHEAALAELVERGLTYRASAAGARSARRARRRTCRPGAYPGTCRDLTAARGRRRARPRAGRRRCGCAATAQPVTIVDRLHGEVTRPADDIVLRRNDGVPAYHVAVVVDDDDQGVEEVVRGDDLLDATPSQAHLLDLLGRPAPDVGARPPGRSVPTARASPSATAPSRSPTSPPRASMPRRGPQPTSPPASASPNPASRSRWPSSSTASTRPRCRPSPGSAPATQLRLSRPRGLWPVGADVRSGSASARVGVAERRRRAAIASGDLRGHERARRTTRQRPTASDAAPRRARPVSSDASTTAIDRAKALKASRPTAIPSGNPMTRAARPAGTVCHAADAGELGAGATRGPAAPTGRRRSLASATRLPCTSTATSEQERRPRRRRRAPGEASSSCRSSAGRASVNHRV